MKSKSPAKFLQKFCLFLVPALLVFVFQNCSDFAVSPIPETLKTDSDSTLGTEKVAPTSVGYDIIVVAGQSNAAGFGISGNGDFSPDDVSDSSIFQIGRMQEVSHDMRILPLTEFVDANGVRHKFLEHWGVWTGWNLYGFPITFARQYSKSVLPNGRKILIVPAGCAGSSILEWVGNKTCARAPTSTSLYADLLLRTRLALNQPGTNRVVAFLWQQGESDVGMNSSQYGLQVAQLFRKVRADLQIGSDVPILAGAMVPNWLRASPGFANKVAIESEIARVVHEDINGGFVETAGLVGNFESGLTKDTLDNIHFSAVSQVKLGQRYFLKWLSLMGKKNFEISPNPGPEWTLVGDGDFNSDGSADLIWQNGSGSAVVWLMNRSFPISSHLIAQLSPDWRIVGTGNFTGSDQVDIIWQNKVSGLTQVWPMNGLTPIRSGITVAALDPIWKARAVGDFNLDGQSDLLWQSSSGQSTVWLLNGTVERNSVEITKLSPDWVVVDTGDFNGDRKSDLLWLNVTTGNIVVWLMNGGVQIGSADQSALPGHRLRGCADMNGDGKPDLLFQNASGELVVRFMNGVRPF